MIQSMIQSMLSSVRTLGAAPVLMVLLASGLTACGGSGDKKQPSPPIAIVTPQPTAVPTMMPSSTPEPTPTPRPASFDAKITSIAADALFGESDPIVVTAEASAGAPAISLAKLWVNGSDAGTDDSAPFSWNSADVQALKDLNGGRHTVLVELFYDGTVAKDEVKFRVDGTFQAPYVAVNWTSVDIGKYYVSSEGIRFKNVEAGFGPGPIGPDAEITGTEDDPLYRHEANAVNGASLNLSWPVPNGTYDLVLHMSELWHDGVGASPDRNINTDTGIGARLFDIKAEDEYLVGSAAAEDGLDVFALVGFAAAHIVDPAVVSIDDGKLDLSLEFEKGDPKIAALSLTKDLNAWDDEDGDKVPNFDDFCLNTAANAVVDAKGCAPDTSTPPPAVPLAPAPAIVEQEDILKNANGGFEADIDEAILVARTDGNETNIASFSRETIAANTGDYGLKVDNTAGSLRVRFTNAAMTLDAFDETKTYALQADVKVVSGRHKLFVNINNNPGLWQGFNTVLASDQWGTASISFKGTDIKAEIDKAPAGMFFMNFHIDPESAKDGGEIHVDNIKFAPLAAPPATP